MTNSPQKIEVLEGDAIEIFGTVIRQVTHPLSKALMRANGIGLVAATVRVATLFYQLHPSESCHILVWFDRRIRKEGSEFVDQMLHWVDDALHSGLLNIHDPDYGGDIMRLRRDYKRLF